jgi:putative ABC transport system substrate-binding protein
MKVVNYPSVVSVIFGAMFFTLCLSAEAQQPRRVTRIGYLDSGTAADSAELLDVFRKQMTQLDWIEGKNLTIEYRYADGNRDRHSELAFELVRLKPDAIVANNTETTLAIKKATSTIPIVMITSTDPGVRANCKPGETGRECHGEYRLLRRASWKKTRNPQGDDS